MQNKNQLFACIYNHIYNKKSYLKYFRKTKMQNIIRIQSLCIINILFNYYSIDVVSLQTISLSNIFNDLCTCSK